MHVESFEVDAPNVVYSDQFIESTYEYQTTKVEKRGNKAVVRPVTHTYKFRTERNVPKLGMMLVGLGGNNGSTITAGIIANKLGLKWNTKDGVRESNFFGSLTQASTVRIGNIDGEEVNAPFSALLPTVKPEDIVIGGWDISKMNLADAMGRAKVR
jgi:myo-inositol-1-phosphate synthase